MTTDAWVQTTITIDEKVGEDDAICLPDYITPARIPLPSSPTCEKDDHPELDVSLHRLLQHPIFQREWPVHDGNRRYYACDLMLDIIRPEGPYSKKELVAKTLKQLQDGQETYNYIMPLPSQSPHGHAWLSMSVPAVPQHSLQDLYQILYDYGPTSEVSHGLTREQDALFWNKESSKVFHSWSYNVQPNPAIPSSLRHLEEPGDGVRERSWLDRPFWEVPYDQTVQSRAIRCRDRARDEKQEFASKIVSSLPSASSSLKSRRGLGNVAIGTSRKHNISGTPLFLPSANGSSIEPGSPMIRASLITEIDTILDSFTPLPSPALTLTTAIRDPKVEESTEDIHFANENTADIVGLLAAAGSPKPTKSKLHINSFSTMAPRKDILNSYPGMQNLLKAFAAAPAVLTRHDFSMFTEPPPAYEATVRADTLPLTRRVSPAEVNNSENSRPTRLNEVGQALLKLDDCEDYVKASVNRPMSWSADRKRVEMRPGVLGLKHWHTWARARTWRISGIPKDDRVEWRFR